MHRSLKRKLVVGGAVLAVAASAGGAYAATQNSGANTRQAFLDDVAKRLHVTPQQLSSALNGAFLDQLQAAVKAGHLTQAQANALAQRLKQGGAPPAVPFGLPGPRPALPWGLGGGFGAFGGAGGGLAGAADYLGISDVQLFQQLAAGKSLAQIAASRGKTVSGLEQAMTTAEKTQLDKLVANKVITSAQEQQILSHFSARLSQLVNQKGPLLRQPAFRFRGGLPPRPYFRGGIPPRPNFRGGIPPRPNFRLSPVPGSGVPVPYAAPIA